MTYIGNSAAAIDSILQMAVTLANEIDMHNDDANRHMRDLADVLADCRRSYVAPAIREASKPHPEEVAQTMVDNWMAEVRHQRSLRPAGV